jgi:hypothetical protein
MISHAMKLCLVLLIALSCAPAQAESRTSPHYSLTAETQNLAGERVTSSSYRMDVAAGNPGATAASATGTLQGGFAGQLTEIAGLGLSAEQNSVAETATQQLSATLTLDDGTLVILPANKLVWAVQNGPGAGVSSDGLFFAGSVYLDSTATASASYGGIEGTVDITVINVTHDDFGAYAGDGLGDDWQHQHFGSDNPSAAPDQDPDNDGISNLFEFTAGLDPTSADSVFRQIIARDASQPSLRSIVFGPISPEVIYTVESSPALGKEANWQPLIDFTIGEVNGQRIVTDTRTTAPVRFYRIRLERSGEPSMSH